MSGFTIDQQITLVEVFVILVGIGITWAVYYGSENAELPGEATVPDPGIPEELMSDPRGRTLK